VFFIVDNTRIAYIIRIKKRAKQPEPRRKTMIKAYARETGEQYPLCSLLGEPDHDGLSTVAPKYREGNVVWVAGERCVVYVSDQGKEYLVPTTIDGSFYLVEA
jgi:hypothetical protein